VVIAGARPLCIVATLLTWCTAALAQSPVAVNPRAFEFDFPAEELPDIVGYWVEVFPSGLVTKTTQPLRVIYVARPSRGSQGGLRVELGNDFDGLADGEYVVTLSVVSRFRQSPWSAPSEPFALSGRANRAPPRGALPPRRVSTEPPPQSAPVAAAATPHNEPHSRSRWWTVAIVAGAALGIFAPFFF
jgi:hypothetical protein